VTVVCSPQDYAPVLAALQAGGSPSAALRRQLAARAFARTQQYDAAIAAYLADAEAINVQAYAVQALRYGENPHQAATLFGYVPGAGPLGGRVLQGKELSYNNLLDLDAAWRAVADYPQPAACIVKHLSPCGMAAGAQLSAAVAAAIACDALSAFGGVLAANRCFDSASVLALQDLFVECIAAPEFDAAALAQLAARKNCRLLQLPPAAPAARSELRSVSGGLLVQAPDLGDPPNTQWQVVSKRAPSAAEHSALRFAWLACQHVKSNAIVLVHETATVGIGGGQPNRVDCVRSAIQRAGARAHGAVLASDAFFPFPDSVALAAAAGVTAIIHPGGSVRDAETLAVADAAGMAMVHTGVRHFRH
jgi:phosphoribosylaminoimidazolecarboxamide formyltransferase/IMP cyclohydrolase